MAIDYVSIGKRIRYFRIKNKLSQEQLAELASLSNVYISNIERGERAPSLEAIINIANALNTTANDLLSTALLVSSTQPENDDVNILHDCSIEEAVIIRKCMAGLKDILRGYKISK